MKEPIDQIVEEADIELCAAGFDNFLMGPEMEELEYYLGALNQIGATKTAKTVKELLDWVSSDKSKLPLDIVEADPKRISGLWDRYNECSVEEDPRKLAIEYQTNSNENKSMEEQPIQPPRD